MKVLVITVAGMSSRFSESVGYPCLKCLYHKQDTKESLLYRLLYQAAGFDKYIIVGGFLFDELEAGLRENFTEWNDRILLVKNEKYAEYGSGYSLYLGLQAALEMGASELVFAEGDLYIDTESFKRVLTSRSNVVTYNRDVILANKAVAFYFDMQDRIHYIYDVAHNALEIKEPFLGIFNSGQVWKFVQPKHLRKTVGDMAEADWRGTNLVFVQKYFETMKRDGYELIGLERWINCNTVSDFEKIIEEKYEDIR